MHKKIYLTGFYSIIILFCSFAVNAEQENFIDINYLLYKGERNIKTEISIAEYSNLNKSYEKIYFSETYNKALTDNTTYFFNIKYGSDDDETVNDRNGITNPIFGIKSRIIAAEMILDVEASIKPDIVETDDSDMIEARDVLNLALTIGQTDNFSSHRVTTKLTQKSAYYDEVSNTEWYYYDRTLDAMIQYQIQYLFSEIFAMDLILAKTFKGTKKTSEGNYTGGGYYDFAFNIDLGILKFNLVQTWGILYRKYDDIYKDGVISTQDAEETKYVISLTKYF